MSYNISIQSTALFSTWINVEELNLLIDAGDGLSAGLLQKARKIKHVFITHPDRDHLHGLGQFMQLNARSNFPVIHYPKDAGSFPALQQFLYNFDPHTKTTDWIGIEDKQVIPIKKSFEIHAMRNEHVQVPMGVHKSLSYKLYEKKQKLKAEFQGMNGNEIQKIVSDKGKDFISETIKNNIISFSGDTPVDDYSKWDKSEILIHEATFLESASGNSIERHGNKHATLEEVMQMIKEIQVNTLILNHFSARYDKAQIDHAVLKSIKDLKIDIPVYLVYPGEIKRDILSGKAINA